jgi:hypothetical protein
MSTATNWSHLLRRVALAGSLALLPAAVQAQSEAEKPQYGGTLNIGMVYVTLSPLAWDPADWAWKFQQDTGLMYEQLFAADLTKSKRNGGPIPSSRTLAPDGRHPRRTGGKLAVEGQSASRRNQAAQGRDVSGKARRDGGARTGR